MCIFDIVSSLEGWPSGCDPCPLQGLRSPEKEPFVPSCRFFLSPYGPRDLPCSAWACRSPAISTWAGDFRTMDRAVRPAYRKRGKEKFYPVCLLPQRRVDWKYRVGMGHPSLFSASRDPRRGGDWNGMRIMKNGSLSMETAITSGKSVQMEISVTWLVGWLVAFSHTV